MDAARILEAFDAHGAGLGHAAMIDQSSAPGRFDCRAGRGNAPAGLTSDDHEAHGRRRQVQILGMRNFGEMERIRWRASENRDAMIYDGVEPRGARNPAEGQDERSVLRGRFLSAPESDKRTE